MRGDVERQTMILSAGTPDQLIPQDHPIRLIKPMVDRALAELSPTFSRMYAKVGRPSIPPEHLLKGCLLMALYTIRSDRQFCERLQYDLLFKWFLDLNIMDPGCGYPCQPIAGSRGQCHSRGLPKGKRQGHLDRCRTA